MDQSQISQIIKFIRATFNEPESFIPLHEPRFCGNERKYVMDAIDSTFVSSVGKYVNQFEEMMCNITGSKYAIATVNGTSALHMALLLAGVEKGDEVITQSLTFVATGNAIDYCNATPVFLDVDKETMGLSVSSVKKFLEKSTIKKDGKLFNKNTNKRIAAVVPMHTFGHPMKIDELVELCNNFGVPVVEDAAESLGSYYKELHTGTFGLVSAVSFNGNKTVTCGGGGAILTNDEELAKKAKYISTTAKVPHKWEYVHDMIGYNYRMPNLNAAMACAQLEQLANFVEKKRVLAQKYSEFFKNIDCVLFNEPQHSKSNYWLNALVLNSAHDRDTILESLNEAGVMTRPIWKLLHKLDMFSECYYDSQENAEWFEERVVNIPSSVIL